MSKMTNTPQQPALTHEAVSLIKGKDGQFRLVLIPFNPETLSVGKPDVRNVGPERMEAQARFKIAAGERFPVDFTIKENG